jgi:hypothetical protein
LWKEKKTEIEEKMWDMDPETKGKVKPNFLIFSLEGKKREKDFPLQLSAVSCTFFSFPAFFFLKEWRGGGGRNDE